MDPSRPGALRLSVVNSCMSRVRLLAAGEAPTMQEARRERYAEFAFDIGG